MNDTKFHILDSKNLHHAYIIEGNKENILPELLAFLESEHGVSTRGNPDFWCRKFDSFGINDARNIRVLQSRKAVSGEHKFFIIAFTAITTEAQNALLKILEEPTSDTHFFLITPLLKQILSTLLSRAVVVNHKVQKSYDISYEKKVQEFLHASPSKRISFVQNIIKEKDKNAAQQFLNTLEVALWQGEDSKERTANTVYSLEEVIQARKHLTSRSPSLKLILEHVALVIPTYK